MLHTPIKFEVRVVWFLFEVMAHFCRSIIKVVSRYHVTRMACVCCRAYNFWSWVPIVGPHIGSVLSAWIYIAGVGEHLRQRNPPPRTRQTTVTSQTDLTSAEAKVL